MVFTAIFTPGEIAAAGVVFPVVDTLLVLLRLRIKRQRLEKLTLEDWFVIPALVLMIAMGILTIVGVATHAEGYVTSTSDLDDLKYDSAMIQIIFWNTTWMQTLALGCLKLSFIFLYRRLFNVGGPRSAFNISSIVSIVVVSVWTASFFLAIMLFCPGHVDAFWTSLRDEQKYCWDLTGFFYALYWSDVATDLLVILLPIPSILSLRMDVRRKFAVACVFLLGFLTIAASITRAILFTNLVDGVESVVALFPNKSNTNGLYLLLIETGFALIAINLPILYTTIKNDGTRSIFRRIKRSATEIVSSTTSSSKRKSKGAASSKPALSQKGTGSQPSQAKTEPGQSESGTEPDSETKSMFDPEPVDPSPAMVSPLEPSPVDEKTHELDSSRPVSTEKEVVDPDEALKQEIERSFNEACDLEANVPRTSQTEDWGRDVNETLTSVAHEKPAE